MQNLLGKLKLTCALMLLFPSMATIAQQRTITGRVTDQNMEPLTGVTVYVRGTTTGTISDATGHYELSAAPDDSIIFSYIGFQTMTEYVGNKNEINVEMKQAVVGMDEVVVIGYGTQRKSDITGTVASLPGERLEKVPNLDVSQAIQGAIPGVMVLTSSAGAAPSNSASNILIRGRNSIRANNEPLIIVDGLPYSGELRDINPNDIQSIEVLKDASSAAIYGSRGSNGVILITSRGGSIGKPQIAYNGYMSVQRITNFPDLMNGEEFYEFKNEREPGTITDSEQEIYENGTWTDWPDLALRDGFSHQHNLSVTGGTGNTEYYIAGNLLDVKGLAVNDNYMRASTRINVESTINSWITVGTRTFLTYDDRSGISPSFSDVFWMNPLTTPYNEDGTLTILPWPEDPYFDNPLSGTLMDNISRSYQAVSNNYLKVEIPYIEGLQYQLNAGVRFKFSDSGTYRGKDTKVGYDNQGTADVSRNTYTNPTVENILSYKRTLGKNQLFFTGLYSFEKYVSDGNSLHAEGFPHDILTWYSAAQANLIEPSFSHQETNLLSQMLRLNYSYDQRYLITLTGRRDGYSGFGVRDKWGFFPSLAVGWNIANEQFFPWQDAINVLKIRFSWGKNGNQAVGAYETISRLSEENYVSGASTLPGYKPSKLGEDNLGWESTETWNLGIDFGLFSNRITGDINLYNANTSDLLLSRSISSVHGLTSITQNIGKTNNKGFEISVNSNNVSAGNFHWTTNGNLAYVKNKIVSLYGELDEEGNEIDDVGNRWFIGEPIRVNFGHVWDGVWQLDEAETAALYGTQPGYIKIRDTDGDTLITADDRRIQGQLDPNLIWGMTNVISYKNFTLSFFIHGVHGVTKSNPLMTDNVWTEVRRNTTRKNWWTPENPTNEWYMNHIDANKQGGTTASKYENASFIRIKDISISYDLPPEFLSRIGFTKLRVYITGRNLFTFTEWTGLDPELDGQRAIPLQKEYVLGLNIGF